MSDRELLEMAAKAAGLQISLVNDFFYVGTGTGHATYWNPLDDDGDALRLAAKLRISIDHNRPADHQRWVAAYDGYYLPVSSVEDEFEESERPAATRRAIVRAAAEIGKAMEG